MKVLMLALFLLFWTGCTRTATPKPPRFHVSRPECGFEQREGKYPVRYETEYHCKAVLTTDDPELKSRVLWIVLTRKRILNEYGVLLEKFQDDESLQTKVIMRRGTAKISSNVTCVVYQGGDGCSFVGLPKPEWEPIGFVPLQNYELAAQQ